MIAVWAAVAATAYACDQATKWWAEHSLDEGQPRHVIGTWFSLSRWP
jgi:hypothetical protein